MDGFVVEATIYAFGSQTPLRYSHTVSSPQRTSLDCPSCCCGFHIPTLLVVLSQHLLFLSVCSSEDLYCQLCFETAIDPAMVFFISRLDFVIRTVLPAKQWTCKFGSWEETKVCFVLHLQRRLDKNLHYWYFSAL